MSTFAGVWGGEGNSLSYHVKLSYSYFRYTSLISWIVPNINLLSPETNRSRMSSFVIMIMMSGALTSHTLNCLRTEISERVFLVKNLKLGWTLQWRQGFSTSYHTHLSCSQSAVRDFQIGTSGSKQQNSSISKCNFRKRRDAALSFVVQSYANMKTEHWLFMEKERKKFSTNTEHQPTILLYFFKWFRRVVDFLDIYRCGLNIVVMWPE